MSGDPMPPISALQPATVDQVEQVKATVEQLRAEVLNAQQQTTRALQEARSLLGTPAAQLAKVLETIGQMSDCERFVSIEVLSPDKDIKQPTNQGYGNTKTIGETGWTIRLSKSNQPFTVVNNFVSTVTPPEEPTGTVDD